MLTSGSAVAQETYSSPQELWQRVNGDKERDWYAPAVAHWDKQPATYDGVLAGLGHLNGCDIAESRTFLKKAFAKQLAAAAAGERRLVGLGAGGSVFVVMTAAQVSGDTVSAYARADSLPCLLVWSLISQDTACEAQRSATYAVWRGSRLEIGSHGHQYKAISGHLCF